MHGYIPKVFGGQLFAQQDWRAADSIPDHPAALSYLGNEFESVMPPLHIRLIVTLHEAGNAPVKGCKCLWVHKLGSVVMLAMRIQLAKN